MEPQFKRRAILSHPFFVDDHVDISPQSRCGYNNIVPVFADLREEQRWLNSFRKGPGIIEVSGMGATMLKDKRENLVWKSTNGGEDGSIGVFECQNFLSLLIQGGYLFLHQRPLRFRGL